MNARARKRVDIASYLPMKRLFPLLCSTMLAMSAFASDQIRNVQTELKEQGFYYGDVTGTESAELTAAIRRYQIRNGLEVTGALNGPTLRSLGFEGAPAAAAQAPKSAPAAPRPEPPRQTVTPPAPTKPPVNLRRESTVREDDRRFLERDTQRRSTPADRSVIRPPAPLDEYPVEPSSAYEGVFAGSPYATAPRALQEQTVRRAQALLASRGFYRDAVDGDPGPATEEAILAFQRASRLPLTGRLDLQTLSQLRLLPGRGTGNPALRPFNASPDEPPRRRVYRGVWVE